jgi:excisionase family DNA binding protein
MTDNNEPLADCVAVAAKRMGISRSLFYIEMRAGHIETRKIGRRTLVPRTEQARWLAALPVSQVAAA